MRKTRRGKDTKFSVICVEMHVKVHMARDTDSFELGQCGGMNSAASLSAAVTKPSHKISATIHCHISYAAFSTLISLNPLPNSPFRPPCPTALGQI